MLNQGAVENKAESVDVKEYLAVLLKRKWLVLVCFLLSMAGATAFLFTRQPIYRASAKLLITSAGQAIPTSEVVREGEGSFFATQIDIMLSQTMLKRVQQRLKKTVDEVRENLTNLKVTPVRNADIIMVTVDSPSTDFARDFANALCDEYLRFREEQRAQTQESALLMLTREVNRLSQELKASNEKMLSWAKDHNVDPLSVASGQSYNWYKRYQFIGTTYNAAIQRLAEAKMRKQLLDSQPDTSTVIALLAAGSASPTEKTSQTEVPTTLPAQQVVTNGMVLNVRVEEDPDLNSRLQVSAAGIITYPPLGRLAVTGMTLQQLAETLKQGLIEGKKISPAVFNDGREATFDKATLRSAMSATVHVEPVTPDASEAAQSMGNDGLNNLNRASLGVLNEIQAQRLFELERKRRALETQLADLRKVYKPKHPGLTALEQSVQEVNSQISSEIEFLREKAGADYSVAQRKMEEFQATVKELDAAAFLEGQRSTELKVMKDESDRIQNLYNTLLSQLMKIDVSHSFNTRTVSVLEPAVLEVDPVYPKKVKGLLVAAFFGLGLGLALAFFIEYIDDSIKLAEEVERDLQLPFLGMIPAAQWSADDLTAHRLDKLKQQGGVAEAYRVVRSAIIFSTPREKLRSILLTSAVPREGKTTTCVNLSIGFAQIEERVLLIDGDLRRGEVHKYFGFDREKGLSDILLGEATADQVVKHTSVPKLDVITSGMYPANPAELLLGWRLKELLAWAYKNYDRVIIDCTPVMGIADSAILGSAVDGCLFVIWAGRTSRRYVRVAKMTAVSRGAKIFGFVLNNLEPGRVGYYHYYPYYYSYYSRGYYYTRPEEEDAGKGGDIKGVEVPSPEGGEEKIDDVY
jgi:capsular exopolysaccharide synthesis family protein